MKITICILSLLIYTSSCYAQGNHVFSGGEAANFNIVDIPTAIGATWSTDRAALPGYFSVVNSAAYTGCSDAANINGYIKKYGNNNFIFPVGSGTDLRTLEISAPASATDAYATAWIVGDPSGNLDPTLPNAGAHSIFSVTSPIVSVSDAGQWDWQVGNAGSLGTGTTGTGTGLTISVSIPDMTAFAITGNLRLVGWNGSSWVDLSGTSTATGNTENSILTGTMIGGITGIAIGSTTLPLPLKLEQFNAAASNCNAELSWRTSSEINTDKFIIEQSFDGSNFSTVATVKAKGNSGSNDYNYISTQSSPIAYYRLKMLDQNGMYTYSKIIACHNTCAQKEFMLVYPNPVVATGTLYLSFATSYKGSALLIITNTLGQRFMNKPLQVTAGSNLQPIMVGTFASGTYFISVFTATGERIGTVQKFIKQ
jgi:hypothetical protein